MGQGLSASLEFYERNTAPLEVVKIESGSVRNWCAEIEEGNEDSTGKLLVVRGEQVIRGLRKEASHLSNQMEERLDITMIERTLDSFITSVRTESSRVFLSILGFGAFAAGLGKVPTLRCPEETLGFDAQRHGILRAMQQSLSIAVEEICRLDIPVRVAPFLVQHERLLMLFGKHPPAQNLAQCIVDRHRRLFSPDNDPHSRNFLQSWTGETRRMREHSHWSGSWRFMVGDIVEQDPAKLSWAAIHLGLEAIHEEFPNVVP